MNNTHASVEGASALDEEIIVKTINLTREFGDQLAVDQLNLEIKSGSIFGFIGPSGCGKTTTVRLLTGYYAPTSGEARVFDRAPLDFTRDEREKIGYMPQHFVLYQDLSVWQNLSFAASMYGLGLRRRKKLTSLLDFVALEEHQKKTVRNISGGMQRRLALAATLVHDPRLLFMDEPTGGIDPILRRKFWDYFQSLKDQGKTLFITTQYISEASYCDMVGVMNEGRLIAVDTPSGLRRRALGGDCITLKAVERIDYRTLKEMEALPFILENIERVDENEVRLVVDKVGQALPKIIKWCEERQIEIESIQEYLAPFDSVFVTLIENHNHYETNI